MSRLVSMACLLAALVTAPPATLAEVAPSTQLEQPRMRFLGGFLRETRIVYPLVLGKWEAQGEKRHEPIEAGVSVRFAAKEATVGEWIDIYFYPVGLLSADEVATLASQEREALKQRWIQGPAADGGELSSLHVFHFSLPGADREAEPVTGYSVDLTYEGEGSRRNSAMVLAFERLYMIKARYSTKDLKSSRSEVRKIAESFVTDLLPKLSITSTGGCWQPLPIGLLAAGAIVPKGALFSQDTNGKATEHVYADRVLASDPQSTSANAAMIFGMAMQGRLYQGCDGSEPMNPDVPERMREIRIDYRPPGNNPPSAGPRTPRSGVG